MHLCLCSRYRKMFIGGLSWQTSPGKCSYYSSIFGDTLFVLFAYFITQHLMMIHAVRIFCALAVITYLPRHISCYCCVVFIVQQKSRLNFNLKT